MEEEEEDVKVVEGFESLSGDGGECNVSGEGDG